MIGHTVISVAATSCRTLNSLKAPWDRLGLGSDALTLALSERFSLVVERMGPGKRWREMFREAPSMDLLALSRNVATA